MSENNLWAVAWGLLAAVAIAIAISICTANVYASYKFAEMVKAGADPIRVRCGYYGDGGGDKLDCNILIMRAAK